MTKDWTDSDTYKTLSPEEAARLAEEDAIRVEKQWAEDHQQEEEEKKRRVLDWKQGWENYAWLVILAVGCLFIALLLVAAGFDDARRIANGQEVKWDIPGHGRVVNPPITAQQYLRDNPLPEE